MPVFEDIPGALAQISTFMMAAGATLPSMTFGALVASCAVVSPVDRIVQFGRVVHEHRDVLNVEARQVGAAALAFAAQYGWNGLESEAPAMIAALLAEG